MRDLFSLALEASSEMAEIAQGLEIDSERMRANLDTTNEVVFSERLSTALLPRFGRIEAQELVAELVRQSIEQNRKLSLVAAEDPRSDPYWTRKPWIRCSMFSKPSVLVRYS